MKRKGSAISRSAEQLLAELAGLAPPIARRRPENPARRERDIGALIAADLLARHAGGVTVTSAGLAHLARAAHAATGAPLDPFRAQHLDLAQSVRKPQATTLTIDESESPLAWLARRKGPDGRPHIEAVQLQAGERLRADFTYAQLMPRTTSNWTAPAAGDRHGAAPANFTDAVIAARQRLRHALDAVGPEFAGLLLDVCCFLKGLVDVERERSWPPRSAKVVLQLGLDRLARHYGLAGEARGRARAPLRAWLAPDVEFVVEE